MREATSLRARAALPGKGSLGPVSTHLAEQVQNSIRQHRLVMWVDASGAFTPLVDALEEQHRASTFPFPIVRFRGSFLEVLLDLESWGSGRDAPLLLVHVPGFPRALLRETPLLEVYEPSHFFEIALASAVRAAATGRLAPDVIDAYLTTPGLTLAGADAWLTRATQTHETALGDLGKWLVATSLQVIVDELVGRDTCLRAKLETNEDIETLAAFLHQHTGMNAAWRVACRRESIEDDRQQIAFATAAWILCVEFVRDLARAPHDPTLLPLHTLATPFVDTCRGLIATFRSRYPERYVHFADLIERTVIASELSKLRPNELGRIDTFRSEERSVLQAAIEALEHGDWAFARDRAIEREGSASFWLERDKHHRWEWLMVGLGAAFAEQMHLQPRPLAGATTIDEACEIYRSRAFEVDRAHRRFEQGRVDLLDLRQEHFIDLRDNVTRALRMRYRAWCDELAIAFAGLCETGGFLPGPARQQRMFFEDVVLPLTRDGERVVVFLVDALRFEMATELLPDVSTGGANATLSARLSELPSLTAVGMNVVAPVQEKGRLKVSLKGGTFGGFVRGEYRVFNPESRARAMGERAIGSAATQMKLDDVCSEDPAVLRKRVQASKKLIVVHSTEIDDAGEASLGLSIFEKTLRDLRNAFTHMQAAGVKQFVFTSDHGFMLVDPTVSVNAWGTKRDPSRRHVYSRDPRTEPDLLTVPLSHLGYDGDPGCLLFRRDTGVFDTTHVGGTFVHGGNSLQERVVPVLTVTREREASRSSTAYKLTAKKLNDVLGVHVVEILAEPERKQATLDFAGRSTLEIALRVDAHPDVSLSVRDASGGARMDGNRIVVTVGAADARVYFTLRGPRDEKVALEVSCPDGSERVTSSSTDDVFEVEREVSPPPPPMPSGRWQDRVTDESARRVLEHLDTQGSVREQDIVKLLGSPRAARKFSLAIDEYLGLLPFRVRIEVTDEKVYVKDGER